VHEEFGNVKLGLELVLGAEGCAASRGSGHYVIATGCGDVTVTSTPSTKHSFDQRSAHRTDIVAHTVPNVPTRGAAEAVCIKGAQHPEAVDQQIQPMARAG
jgi:hypothetical protein